MNNVSQFALLAVALFYISIAFSNVIDSSHTRQMACMLMPSSPNAYPVVASVQRFHLTNNMVVESNPCLGKIRFVQSRSSALNSEVLTEEEDCANESQQE